MPRRVILLSVALASCAALFAAYGPKISSLLPQRPPPPPLDIESLVDDGDGVLLAARRPIENELWQLDAQLGITVHVVMGAGGEDPDARAAAKLEERATARDGETGRALVLVDHGQRRIGFAATDAVRAAASREDVRALLIGRAEPFVGEPMAAVSIAAGLERLRDHLLEQAVAGRLALGERARDRASLRAVGDANGRIEAACRGGPSAAGAEIDAAIATYACLLGRGALAPDSDILTEASRVHVARRAPLRFEGRVQAAALLAARPWSVSAAGDRAALTTPKPIRDLVPVLLVREQGTWRVDLVEMGKTFQRSGYHWKRVNAQTPYWLALGGDGRGMQHATDLSPIELWGEPLGEAIARLEHADGPLARSRLAEILLRNAWLPGEAMVRWDEALAMAPDDLDRASVFADRAEYAGYPLLGAIALAPHGPPALSRIGELFLAAGQIEPGVDFLRRAKVWRDSRRAERAQVPAHRVPSI